MNESPSAPPPPPAESKGGFHLLGLERFRAFFWTQFLGALNDNVYRNALIGLLTFQAASVAVKDSYTIINLSVGLFILPFFLLSALAGQLADKYEKSILIQRIKIVEICIMLIGGLALILHSLWLLLLVVFLMGAQSTFFGPVKYGILPQHLRNDELVGGNAMVELGTFSAILIGTIAGGLLIDIDIGVWAVTAVVLCLGFAGWRTSRAIPPAPPVAPQLKINLNIVSATWQIMATVRNNRTVLLAVMGISWFWFFGSVLLAQLPAYVRDILGGGQSVATMLLAVFTLGIGVGSLICERWSGHRVEIGLVPIGAAGLAAFALHMSLIYVPPEYFDGTFIDFLSQGTSWEVLIDLFGIALSGGLYIVPLYALIQTRAKRNEISRVIAVNNIINALFMVVGAIVTILMFKAGLNIPQLILAITLMHVAVAVFIFYQVPEFVMRLVVWLMLRTLYRVHRSGIDHIPDQGPAVLVCNHVSLVDALIVGAAARRPVRFVMYHKIFEIPFLNYLFRAGRAIPIASAKEDPALLEAAYDEIATALEAGELVGIFPEGQLTTDGRIGEFRHGIERIIERTPTPVVPMALQGLWGSFFSRFGGEAMRRWPTHWQARVNLLVDAPIEATEATAAALYERVDRLRGEFA